MPRFGHLGSHCCLGANDQESLERGSLTPMTPEKTSIVLIVFVCSTQVLCQNIWRWPFCRTFANNSSTRHRESIKGLWWSQFFLFCRLSAQMADGGQSADSVTLGALKDFV